MYIDNRVLYDSDGNPCTIGDKVEITCDDGEIIIDTITDITDDRTRDLRTMKYTYRIHVFHCTILKRFTRFFQKKRKVSRKPQMELQRQL